MWLHTNSALSNSDILVGNLGVRNIEEMAMLILIHSNFFFKCILVIKKNVLTSFFNLRQITI